LYTARDTFGEHATDSARLRDLNTSRNGPIHPDVRLNLTTANSSGNLLVIDATNCGNVVNQQHEGDAKYNVLFALAFSVSNSILCLKTHTALDGA
jgi:hypothetical protein